MDIGRVAHGAWSGVVVLALAAAIAFAAAWHPLLALGALGAAVVGLLVLTNPFGVLLLLVAAFPWDDKLHYPSASVSVVKLLGVLLMAGYAFRALGGARDRGQSPAALPAVLLVGLLAGVSLIVSPDPSAGVVAYSRIVLFIVLFFLVTQLASGIDDIRWIMRVFVASSAAAAVSGLTAFLTGSVQLARGPIGDPNDFAFLLGTVLPLAAYLAVHDRRARVLWSIAFVLVLAAMLATLSRGGIVGIAAVVVWAVATRRVPVSGIVATVVGIFGVLALAVVFSGPLINERLASKDQAAGKNVESRQAFWMGAVRMAMDRPLFGVGPGRFGTESVRYVRNNPVALTDPVVHNTYLHLLAENGIFVLVAFLAYLTTTWRLLSRRARAARALADRDVYRLATALQAALLLAVVSAMFLSEQGAAPLWLLGALAAVLGGARVQAPRPARVASRRVAALPA